MIYQALAAADADLLLMATTTVESLSENVIGVLSEVVPTIAIIFVSVLAVFFVFKLVRRAIGR